MKTMTPNDWLQLELLQWVDDLGLQKRLLQERNPMLNDLISIATQWQNEENAQISFGTEVSEFVRQNVHDPEMLHNEEGNQEDVDDFDCKKNSVGPKGKGCTIENNALHAT